MAQPDDERRVITASESEAQLGLPASSVRAWASQGRIYPVGEDLDGSKWYPLKAVLELREETSRRAPHERPARTAEPLCETSEGHIASEQRSTLPKNEGGGRP